MTYTEQQAAFYGLIETTTNTIALFVMVVVVLLILRSLLRNKVIFKLIKFSLLIIPALILSLIEVIKY